MGGQDPAQRRVEQNLLNAAGRQVDRVTEAALRFIAVEYLEKLFLVNHRAKRKPRRPQRSPHCRRQRSRSHPHASSTKAETLRRRRSARPAPL